MPWALGQYIGTVIELFIKYDYKVRICISLIEKMENETEIGEDHSQIVPGIYCNSKFTPRIIFFSIDLCLKKTL